MMGDAGQKLKRIRERLGLTYRDVEIFSTRIAEVRGSDEFIIALSRLADIENKGTTPSFHRLYSLCAIYRIELTEVLEWFGISMAKLPADAALFNIAKTHKVGFQYDEGDAQVPLALDPGIDLRKTVFLSRFIQRWGKLPLMLLNHVDLKSYAYGMIGTEDWSMFPILAPGSLVVVDQERRKVVNSGWNSEFERPIYFFEHREGYACSWCTLRDSQLTLQPHPSSQQDPEIYVHPDEIEVIGQVTFAAMTLDPSTRRRPQR
jgi:transcriptional regulator with XRE-family HTH domain